MELTIWEISPPIGNCEETDLDPPVFRWTLEDEFLFLCGKNDYDSRKECLKYAKAYLKEHNFKFTETNIKYRERSNWEFLS